MITNDYLPISFLFLNVTTSNIAITNQPAELCLCVYIFHSFEQTAQVSSLPST